MTIVGQRQPNEQVVYSKFIDAPTFVRRTYTFKGLGTNASGTHTTLDELQIATIARTATVDPLPDAGVSVAGLPQTRISVRRYDRKRGHATIVVEWGIRFQAGGGLADSKRESSKTLNTRYTQPYAAILRGDDLLTFEIQSRQILRPSVRVRIERIRTDDGSVTGLVDTIMNDMGKLMPWRGKDRVVVGGGFSPFSQTQGYLSIVLDLSSPVAAVVEDEIISDTGVYGSLPVAALDFNQEYGVPSATTGTPALPLTVPIATYNWMTN